MPKPNRLISVFLVLLLLAIALARAGAAQAVLTPTPAPQASRAPEAQAFYNSVLAARDAAKLHTYLNCLSPERLQELWQMLDTASQTRLQRAMEALGVQPPQTTATGESSLPQGEVMLTQQTDYDSRTDTYTVTLEGWSTGCAAGQQLDESAVLRATLSDEFSLKDAQVRVWRVEKTASGWAQTKCSDPGLSARLDPKTRALAVTGFDYTDRYVCEQPRKEGTGTTRGSKLVVQLTGLAPDDEATFGGQGIPVCQNAGVYPDADSAQPCAVAEEATVDLPIRYQYQPADQTVLSGQAVNFGYMIRPTNSLTVWPDGQNNAWVDLEYAVEQEGQILCRYRVPHGTDISQGQWAPAAPQQMVDRDTCYTVVVTVSAAYPGAKTGPGRGTASHCQSYPARVLLQNP